MTAAAIRRDTSAGLLVSVIFHAGLLAAGGAVLSQGVEYAVDPGAGGIEISLTAAPAEIAETPAVEAPHAEEPTSEPLSSDEMVSPEEAPQDLKAPEPVPAKTEPSRLAEPASAFRGDGSSPVPGQDATTFYSGGGALTEAKPNYLKNPAPAYPWEAREKGWEGVVVLKVAVDKDGRPVRLEREKSSGHDILDESALKTVRKWRFRPARLGAIPVDSTVLVPVRFELDSLKRR